MLQRRDRNVAGNRPGSVHLVSLALCPLECFRQLRISYDPSGQQAGITYIAQRAGLFEKQGLDVEMILITGGPASISALLNADVDLDMRAPVAALQAMAHGVKLTFLLSQSNTLEYDVVTRPEIKDIKQLKGKKVGIIRFGGIRTYGALICSKARVGRGQRHRHRPVCRPALAVEKGAIARPFLLRGVAFATQWLSRSDCDAAVFGSRWSLRRLRGEAGRCERAIERPLLEWVRFFR